ncbi:MAG: c-type cytochrome [Parafilimonas sp.]
MKKCFIVIASLVIVAACNSNTNSGSNSDSSSATADSKSADLSSNPDYQKGLTLIAANDCLTCHKIDEKLVGPSYRDVANKYAGSDTALNYLSHRIIHGVGANDQHDWADQTNNAIMTPHLAVSEADADQMVKYILLLSNK